MSDNRSTEQKVSQWDLAPTDNKFHTGNKANREHYWITPPDLYEQLDAPSV